MWRDLFFVGVSVLGIGIIVVSILYIISIRRNKKNFLKKKELEASYEELENEFEIVDNQAKELLNRYDKMRQNEEKLKKLAYVDTLTQLPNRDAISDEINQILPDLKEDGDAALLYLDVDNLKEINDTLGYTYGDELLLDITYRIKQILTDDDTMGRISGDEFVILTQNIEAMDIYEEKIKKILTVFNYPFSLAEKECFVTVNIGICKLDREIKNANAAIKNANVAMYKAKELGTVPYCYFDEEIKQSLMKQIQIQADVRTAFENDEFFAVYQPILNVKKHKVIGFEIFLRWDSPIEGLVPPEEFLPAAIESGVIVPLGISLLTKACHALHIWEKQFGSLLLIVNLTERQLLDYNIIEDIESIIKQTKVKANQLVFDISEKSYESNEHLVTQRVQELKNLGVQICLDNFGSVKGAINQIYYNRYDFIKLDEELVKEVETNERKASFVESIVGLCKSVDSKVVYEGIKSPEQLEKIESFGEELVQGDLFGDSLMEEEVLGYLQTWMH